MYIALQRLDRRDPEYLAVLPDVVSLLLDKGASVNSFLCSYKETALNMAVRYSHEPLVRFLLERGANVNVRNGRNNLHSSLICFCIQILAILLAKLRL